MLFSQGAGSRWGAAGATGERQEDSTGLKADGYVISHWGDAASEKWGEYLFRHLQKRSRDKSRIILGDGAASAPRFKTIHIGLNPEMSMDYCFTHSSDRLEIEVKQESSMLWVLYQLMAQIGSQDANFEVGDLPPAFLNFESTCGNMDFTYREPHLQPNMEVEYAGILGTHHLERDWGLWGHNLDKVLTPDPALYAQEYGRRTPGQFCFSSEELFNQLSDFIVDQYGYGNEQSHWFMIAPNDNDRVCSCEDCLRHGNTIKSATPALGYLLNKLARAFPEHQFFTLAYRSSKRAPTRPWEENAGVFFTTIDLPKGIDLTGSPELGVWEQDLKAWKKQVENIYLWDYISNFDDYLTPLPNLLSFPQQLSLYREVGIEGLFLNGSGYDYAPFDDMKTYVLAALMINHNLDVEALIVRYFEKFYPHTHELLIDYTLKAERRVHSQKIPYPMYGGFQQVQRSYFSREPFIAFYDALAKAAPEATGDEVRRLEKLLTALSYTRLQVIYHDSEVDADGAFSEATPYLNRLRQYKKYPDMQVFRETGGALTDYLEQWENLAGLSTKSNLVKNGGVTYRSAADEGYENPAMLTDGLPGFSGDYHQGWVINSGRIWELEVELTEQVGSGYLEMGFLNLPRHTILPPVKLEVLAEGAVVATLTPTVDKDDVEVIRGEVTFPKLSNRFVLRVYNQMEPGSSLATDEIKFLNHKTQ